MATVFSKIINGELPADIVYRDELVTCFRDINPAAPVHILIIPNREIPTLNDMTAEDQALAGHNGEGRETSEARLPTRRREQEGQGYRRSGRCQDGAGGASNGGPGSGYQQ